MGESLSMPRDAKDKTPKPKTALERKSIELTDHIFRKLCNEKVFPKRSRWLFSGKIADLCNDYMNCVDLANETRVVTQEERDKRHYWQTMAMSNLMALDARVNQAGRILGIDPNVMEYYAGLVNECRRLLLAWMNSDEKRFGKPTQILAKSETEE